MDQAVSIIQAIVNGIKSPVKSGIGAVIGLLFYFFIIFNKNTLRSRQADNERNESKEEDNSDLENSNANADSTVRDTLQNRK